MIRRRFVQRRLALLLTLPLLALSACKQHPFPEAITVPAPLPGRGGDMTTSQQRYFPSPRPAILPGTGVEVGQPGAPSPAPVADHGDVTLNFANADVRDVAREVLGNILHMNYAVDSKVQATMTLQTGAPIGRDQVLPVMENALRASGLTLIETGGLYRIATIEDAAKTPARPIDGRGYGSRVIPLRYVSAAEVRKTLEPFIGPGMIAQPDTLHNALILSGPPSSVDALASTVALLDTDWMRGMSFATFPIHVDSATNIANELTDVFGARQKGHPAEAVQFIPIERLNTVLVIAAQPSMLTRAQAWIKRLDVRNEEATPQMFQYPVQNARATDLADVLNRLLGHGDSRSRTAPTTRSTVLRGGTLGSGGAVGGSIGGSAGTMGGLSSGLGGGLGGGTGMPGGSLGSLGGGTAGTTALSGTGAPNGTGAVGQSAGDSGDATARAAGLLGPVESAGITGGGGTAGGDTMPLPQARIVADDKNNALVIYAKPADYRMIEGVIRKLDIVPLQVQIEATIAEVTLNDQLQYGLQFFLKNGSSTSVLSNAANGTITSALQGFTYSLITGNQQVIINALASLTNVKVISSPTVLVLDHQTATLQVGDEVPVPVSQSQSQIVPNAPLVSTINYVNTGVILQVSPRVNTNGQVTLDLDQEVSNVSQTANSTLNAPTFNQRRIVSSVVVPDGESIAIGGLIRTDTSNEKSGIPLLKDLPYVGALFSTTTVNKSRTELLVLLSPRVIHDTPDALLATRDLQKRLALIAPLMRAARR